MSLKGGRPPCRWLRRIILCTTRQEWCDSLAVKKGKTIKLIGVRSHVTTSLTCEDWALRLDGDRNFLVGNQWPNMNKVKQMQLLRFSEKCSLNASQLLMENSAKCNFNLLKCSFCKKKKNDVENQPLHVHWCFPKDSYFRGFPARCWSVAHVSELTGVTHGMTWEAGKVEIWFRGKRANVSTRLEGSEGKLFKSRSEKAAN